jgi:hydrogenase maturation protein HypF
MQAVDYSQVSVPAGLGDDDVVRLQARLFGVVQGVGLRPSVLRLAREAKLGGTVQNRSGSVTLALIGPWRAVRAFVDTLAARLPAPALLERCAVTALETLAPGTAVAEFTVADSAADNVAGVVLPTDLAMCAACRAEVLAPTGRRAGYAFTTCTACGPRYTVVLSTPYDRARTTMAPFALCAECQAEYDALADRRCHAETIACPACGPRVWLCDAKGTRCPGLDGALAIKAARLALAAGEIVAVRGIGGFLLAVLATHEKAVARLRQRKHRPHKALAVMARNPEVVGRECHVPEAALAAMQSVRAPIVVLDLRDSGEGALPRAMLTPDAPTLGVMLPTSPLHLLLFEPGVGDTTPAFDWLVMTSANRSDEPICKDSAEAIASLQGVADWFLCHDREIAWRCDDSLCALQTLPGAPGEEGRGQVQVWRRARGYAPAPLPLPWPVQGTVLALGAGLKNTIALAYGQEAVLSPHLGDLSAPATAKAMQAMAHEMPAFLGRAPDRIAVDLHPDLASTTFGEALAAQLGVPLVRVQHHHAHAIACLTEHGVRDALALVFDGTGFGEDGAIWGAELLAVQDLACRRLGTFAAAPLIGGDAAVYKPVRQLAGRLWQASLGTDDAALLAARDRWLTAVGVLADEWSVWQRQCETGLNTPKSHAAGRLFDALAAGLGLAPGGISYEAQAAVKLESAARAALGERLPPLAFLPRLCGDFLTIDWTPAWQGLIAAFGRGELGPTRAPAWALALHSGVAEAGLAMARHGRDLTGMATVALTGGVFQNRLLTELLAERLSAQGFRVLLPLQVPPNDGGIALGQAVLAGLRSL